MNTLAVEVHYKWSPHRGTVKRRADRLVRQMYPALVMNYAARNGTLSGGFTMSLVMFPDKIRVLLDLEECWDGAPTENLIRSMKRIKNVSSVLLTQNQTTVQCSHETATQAQA